MNHRIHVFVDEKPSLRMATMREKSSCQINNASSKNQSWKPTGCYLWATSVASATVIPMPAFLQGCWSIFYAVWTCHSTTNASCLANASQSHINCALHTQCIIAFHLVQSKQCYQTVFSATWKWMGLCHENTHRTSSIILIKMAHLSTLAFLVRPA
jgi:hypothetical protein